MIDKAHFDLFCWIWIGIAIVLFPILINVTQPYGMHTKTSWGPMVNNKLAWFLMEIPALVVFLFFFKDVSNVHHKVVFVSGFLWSMHYIHRAIIYPLRIKTSGKKMPFLIMFFGIFFNFINGFLNGYWLATYASIHAETPLLNGRIVLGILVFLSGFALNKYHDFLLIKLRNSAGKGYKIPYGGLFKYVSCPNFLGEIITWIGFFIVGFSLPALSFAIWTMANLIPRALDHHKWYRKEFIDYPIGRKAIFPFLM